MIPVDSRFCSYCAADLRHTLNVFELGADAETTILNRNRAPSQTRRGYRDRTREHSRGNRARRRFRHPLLIIAAIFALSFIIKMIVLNATVPAAPPPEDSGSIAPPETAPSGDDIRDARLSALRQELDAEGYKNVQFRMNGDVLYLWGTVPTEFDRVAVQTIVFGTAGIALMQDNLRVQDVDADR
jgi:hypothetical protein